jgi:hypothetical protein
LCSNRVLPFRWKDMISLLVEPSPQIFPDLDKLNFREQTYFQLLACPSVSLLSRCCCCCCFHKQQAETILEQRIANICMDSEIFFHHGTRHPGLHICLQTLQADLTAAKTALISVQHDLSNVHHKLNSASKTGLHFHTLYNPFTFP